MPDVLPTTPIAAGVPGQAVQGQAVQGQQGLGGRGLWWWVAAGGLVVAGAGALYLMSARGKKARRGIKKRMKQVKGGLLVAALSGFASKVGGRAAERAF